MQIRPEDKIQTYDNIVDKLKEIVVIRNKIIEEASTSNPEGSNISKASTSNSEGSDASEALEFNSEHYVSEDSDVTETSIFNPGSSGMYQKLNKIN